MPQIVRRVVLLMNLGSPDSTAVKDVRKYLDEFLMDERVIDVPYWWRLLLVKGIIVPFRSPKSAQAYQSVWTSEGSPLVVLTQQLMKALEEAINDPVYYTMRYGNPSPDEVYREILRDHPFVEEVVLLPLYPHYAMSSYETAVVYAQSVHRKGNFPFRLSVIKPYYENDAYLDALCASIAPYLKEEYDQILFSYHGVPERHILKGDVTGQHCLRSADCCTRESEAHRRCYRHQCLSTTQMAADKLAIPLGKYATSFQSRLGRAEWLKPYTAARLAALPGEGVKKLLVVCPAFASDCLETLEEIAVEGREIFLHAGGTSFTMIPCLNTHPRWVATVASWLKEHAAGSNAMMLD